MKSRFLLTALLIFHFSLFTFHCPAQDAEQIYKKVNDAVVTVYAYDSYQKILSQGSGVVLNDKGWIVTNYHVYNGSDKMVVRHNGKNRRIQSHHRRRCRQRHPDIKDNRPYLSIHRNRQQRPLECRAKDICNKQPDGI